MAQGRQTDRQTDRHAERNISKQQTMTAYSLAVWSSGNIVRRMNEVTLRRARLVLGWVSVFGRVYHLGM